MKVEIKRYKASDAHLKMLLYGASGIGKTRFGITAPKPLYLSAESGLLSVAKHKPEYIEVKSMADLNGAYEYLANEKHDYKTVILDSLTEIQNVAMARIAGADRAPSREDWAIFTPEMFRLLRKFRELDMHVIFICLEKKEEDKKKDILYYSPDLFGQVGIKSPAFVDFVGRMAWYRIKKKGQDTEKPCRGISFTDCEDFLAKDRLDTLPGVIDPDFATILKAVGEIETGKEEVLETLDGDDTIMTQRKDDKEEVDRGTRKRKVTDMEVVEEDTESRKVATKSDVDGFLKKMAEAVNKNSEKMLDKVKEEMSGYEIPDDLLEELASYGRDCRREIKGQTKLEDADHSNVPDVKLPAGPSEDTIAAAEAVFGTTKKKTPPKKKSILERLKDAA